MTKPATADEFIESAQFQDFAHLLVHVFPQISAAEALQLFDGCVEGTSFREQLNNLRRLFHLVEKERGEPIVTFTNRDVIAEPIARPNEPIYTYERLLPATGIPGSPQYHEFLTNAYRGYVNRHHEDFDHLPDTQAADESDPVSSDSPDDQGNTPLPLDDDEELEHHPGPPMDFEAFVKDFEDSTDFVTDASSTICRFRPSSVSDPLFDSVRIAEVQSARTPQTGTTTRRRLFFGTTALYDLIKDPAFPDPRGETAETRHRFEVIRDDWGREETSYDFAQLLEQLNKPSHCWFHLSELFFASGDDPRTVISPMSFGTPGVPAYYVRFEPDGTRTAVSFAATLPQSVLRQFHDEVCNTSDRDVTPSDSIQIEAPRFGIHRYELY